MGEKSFLFFDKELPDVAILFYSPSVVLNAAAVVISSDLKDINDVDDDEGDDDDDDDEDDDEDDYDYDDGTTR